MMVFFTSALIPGIQLSAACRFGGREMDDGHDSNAIINNEEWDDNDDDDDDNDKNDEDDNKDEDDNEDDNKQWRLG